jgi:hypothetical protein
VSGLGAGFSFAIGGTVAPGIALAGVFGGTQVTGTFHGGPFSNATVMTSGSSAAAVSATSNASAGEVELGAQLDWFPNPSKGLHFGGSIGVGGVSVTNQIDGSMMTGVGGAASLFGGYNFWIGPSWSLGLGAVAMGATPREQMNDKNRNDTNYRLTPLSFGLELSLLYY